MSEVNNEPPRAPLFLRLVTPVLSAKPVERIHVAPKTVFILSTGRTGTVYLADLLNQLDGILALHEPKPSRVLNAWSTAVLENKASGEYLAAALADKRHKTLQNTKVKLYVESNNFIAGFADVLGQVFDNPTVIHIVRDARDFVTSQTNRGDDTGLRRLINRYVPYWAYVPKGEKRLSLDALSRAAHRWTAVNTYLDEFGRRSKNYHFFKFEDVFNKSDKSELLRLLKAMGLSPKQISKLDFDAKPERHQPKFSLLDRPTDSANKSKLERMKPWRDWAKTDAKRLDAICGPLMKTYGYGKEPVWQKLVK